jgi:hypothetical protein
VPVAGHARLSTVAVQQLLRKCATASIFGANWYGQQRDSEYDGPPGYPYCTLEPRSGRNKANEVDKRDDRPPKTSFAMATDDGFAGMRNKALHLFTEHQALRTERLNINMIFSDDDARQTQWYYCYSRLFLDFGPSTSFDLGVTVVNQLC